MSFDRETWTAGFVRENNRRPTGKEIADARREHNRAEREAREAGPDRQVPLDRLLDDAARTRPSFLDKPTEWEKRGPSREPDAPDRKDVDFAKLSREKAGGFNDGRDPEVGQTGTLWMTVGLADGSFHSSSEWIEGANEILEDGTFTTATWASGNAEFQIKLVNGRVTAFLHTQLS